MTSYKPVTAALRVLDVLAALNRPGTKATVAGIHGATGFDKATVVRMLETLIHAGYVLRDPEQPVYRPTGKTLALATGYDRHKVVGAIVSDDLAQFRQRIGWPSDVALFDHDAMLVVHSSRPPEPLHFIRASGFRAPMLVTSLGLAYLAHCDARERAAVLARLAGDPASENDLARDPARLESRLDQIRDQGFATMDPSYSRAHYEGRFFSLGVPIMADRQVFGAINAMYLLSALSIDEAQDRLLGSLQEVAGQMAARLAQRSGC